MAGLDLPFTAISIDADESYPEGTEGGDIPYFISRAKARAYMSHLKDDQLLITADTIVWLDGRPFGKPRSRAEAMAMLRRLSGTTHHVYTGVAVLRGGTERLGYECTAVHFREIPEEEIVRYVDSGEPMDKAGAYGAQGLGALFVRGIEGDFFNVMGLPLCRLDAMLKEQGVGLL